MMKSVFWWRKPEYREETTDIRQVTDETFHTYGLCPVRGLNLGRSGVKQSSPSYPVADPGGDPPPPSEVVFSPCQYMKIPVDLDPTPPPPRRIPRSAPATAVPIATDMYIKVYYILRREKERQTDRHTDRERERERVYHAVSIFSSLEHVPVKLIKSIKLRLLRILNVYVTCTVRHRLSQQLGTH